MEEATHIQGRTASVDSSGGENIGRPGLRSGEPFGFHHARVCKFHAADHSVNARRVSSRGFGCAAGFCMFQLWVWEGAAASTLPTAHPESVAESFLHVGDVIVRRQDTSRARVQVVKPLVGDLRVTQVFDSCHLLPGPSGEECVLQTPESSLICWP